MISAKEAKNEKGTLCRIEGSTKEIARELYTIATALAENGFPASAAIGAFMAGFEDYSDDSPEENVTNS